MWRLVVSPWLLYLSMAEIKSCFSQRKTRASQLVWSGKLWVFLESSRGVIMNLINRFKLSSMNWETCEYYIRLIGYLMSQCNKKSLCSRYNKTEFFCAHTKKRHRKMKAKPYSALIEKPSLFTFIQSLFFSLWRILAGANTPVPPVPTRPLRNSGSF